MADLPVAPLARGRRFHRAGENAFGRCDGETRIDFGGAVVRLVSKPMAHETDSPTREEIEDRIRRIGTYSRAVRLGLGLILTAFLLAAGVVLPANLDSPSAAVESILMPLTFVGLGTILYGIGMHLHLMHLNLVRQLQPDSARE